MGDGASYRRLVRQIRRFGVDRVRVVSFHAGLLQRVRASAPDIAEGIISTAALTPAQVAPYDSILVDYPAVTEAWLSTMPYPVFVWTPDLPTEWDIVAGKVRAVITNEPMQLMADKPVACPSVG